MDDTCTACGDRNARDAGFCAACGEYLGWDQRGAQADDAQQGEVQPVETVAAVEGGDRRSGATASDAGRPAAEPATGAAAVPVPEATAGAAPARGDEPSSSSAPTATLDPARPAPAADRTCPDCQAVNAPERRFCRRCGFRVAPVEDGDRPARTSSGPRSTTWWQRLGGHRAPGATREARRAYRRSVPLRYRSARAAAVVLPVLLVVGLLTVAGRDPVGSARGLWHDVRDTTVQVEGVVASADPAEGGVPGWPPELAVDDSQANAWATAWQVLPSDQAAPEPCAESVQSPAAQALLLEWPDAVELRSVRVLGGLPEDAPEAASVRGPQLLELRFDSSCLSLDVPAVGEEQAVELERPVRADRVRIAVMTASEVDAPLDLDRVAISSIRFFSRPG